VALDVVIAVAAAEQGDRRDLAVADDDRVRERGGGGRDGVLVRGGQRAGPLRVVDADAGPADFRRLDEDVLPRSWRFLLVGVIWTKLVLEPVLRVTGVPTAVLSTL